MKMKYLTVLLTSFLSLAGVNVYADFTYTESNGKLTITGYAGDAADLVIPSEINGMEVESIQTRAFGHRLNLKTIEIPSSITIIGNSAFINCTELTSVTFVKNSQLTTIAAYAFSGCSSLTSIEIPPSVTTIAREAFVGCSSLISVEIPLSVTTIEVGAFSGCSSLTSIEIPSSVTAIETFAFEDCSSLTSVEIPSSVTTIGGFAFQNCSSLTSITIPALVTTIECSSFSGCTSLKNVSFAENAQFATIATSAFWNCSSLTSIEIPSSVTAIDNLAFYDCASLAEVVFEGLPPNIGLHSFNAVAGGCQGYYLSTFQKAWEEEIQLNGERENYWNNLTMSMRIVIGGNWTWTDQNGLVYTCSKKNDGTVKIIKVESLSALIIEVPSFINDLKVSEIGEGAFAGCSGLEEITIPSSVVEIGASAFSNCRLTAITFAENSQLTTISASAFTGTYLKTIVLPASVKTIGDSAFESCTSLQKIVFEGVPPSLGVDVFSGVAEGCQGFYSADYQNDWNEVLSASNEWKGLTVSALRTWTDENNVIYTYNDNGDGTAEILSVESETVTKIELPATINGLQVIAIGDGAFVECSNLKDLTIPEGVVYLREGWGIGLFEDLESLVIPESICSDSLKMATWREGGWATGPTTFISYGKPPNLEDSGFTWIPILYYSAKYAEEWEAALKTTDFIEVFEEQKICMGNQLHIVPSLFNGGETTQKTKMIGWGETVSITATPYDGFVFLGWGGTLEGVNTTDATISFTMPKKDVILVPNFFPKALIQGWITESVDKAVEEKVDGVNLLTASQAEAATATAIEAQKPALKAEGVAEALENQEVYTKESMKSMAFGQPVMEVKSDEVVVGISLESTNNLNQEFEGVDLEGATLEKDETAKGLFRVKVPIKEDDATSFFKFVVKDETADTNSNEGKQE